MAAIRAFQGLRPKEELAERIAALPYDVYSSSEARRIVEANPLSFLKIDRAETLLPEGTDMYSSKVYECAKDTLARMEAAGEFVQDETACFYIYALTMDGRRQTGLVCCAAIDDYLNNRIKKHENTREDKEIDRIHHVSTCSAHTGPIFLTYRRRERAGEMIADEIQKEALYDFVSEDGIRHQVWKVADAHWIQEMTNIFQSIDSLYIADGHHRAASAVKAGLACRAQNPDFDGSEEFNYFLSVIFPAEELKIFDYNRIVHKLGDITAQELLQKISVNFSVSETGNEIVRPTRKGEIGMYLDGRGYLLDVKTKAIPDDPVGRLDVSILQDLVLQPVLGIGDPKTDPRMQFVGGIRGLKTLEETVDSEGDAVAFAMYPTSMEELLDVADGGLLMPPKSTWFEPKLRSGLLIHKF